MAKESFLCGRCKSNWITVVARSRKEAERRAAWLSDREICESCKQEDRDKENQESAEYAKSQGWCELRGSEKQIAWANTIRKEKIMLINSEVSSSFIAKEIDREICETLSVEEEELPSIKMIITSILSKKESASFWIDLNRMKMSFILSLIKPDLIDFIIESEIDEDEEKKRKERIDEILKEETIRPEETKTNHIIDISFFENKTVLNFEPYDHRYIEILKSHNFEWSDKNRHWWRNAAPYDGCFADRAAQLASELLEEGYIVRCSNNEVREKVIEGTWLPRVQRQAFKIEQGWNKGRIRFIWFDSKKLYNEFKHLPGAKMDNRCHYDSYIVPAVDYNQVLDFAESHGFILSESAIELLESVKKRIGLIPVVTPKKVNHEYEEIDDELKFLYIDEIDESLIDV